MVILNKNMSFTLKKSDDKDVLGPNLTHTPFEMQVFSGMILDTP